MRFGHVGALQRTDAVAEKAQLTRGGDARVELAQAAGGGVARVGEFLLAGVALARVQFGKIHLVHQHFTAHLQHPRDDAAVQPQRNRAHCADVDGDVFTGGAVAARGGLHEHAVLVAQTDRQAVELEFTGVVDWAVELAGVQAFAHRAIEAVDVFRRKAVSQRQHRHAVNDLLELGNRRGADATRRRILGHAVRMHRFERLQLAEHAVVFGVGNGRRVEHVIGVDVAIQFGRQPRHALAHGNLGLYGGHDGHGLPVIQLNKRSARTEPAGMSAAAISS